MMRYSAFISYNHRDRRWARWLHKSLEGYRIPRRLHGRSAPFGVIGSRLPPVFQDREELASSADLAVSVKAALADAATLIVVCSPNSAQSKWVNEEVETFIAAGRRDRILCVIVGGEPRSGDPATECLPPALLGEGTEPLAADARKVGDGKLNAKLKLLAGILAVPYDELRQREAQRRQRRLIALAGGSTMGLMLVSALAMFAIMSRELASEQERVAEQRRVMLDLVKSMFGAREIGDNAGETVTAVEVIDRGARLLENGLQDQPTVRAELAVTLAELYNFMGMYSHSEAMIRQTQDIEQPDAATAARQYIVLGESKFARGDYSASLDAFHRAAELAPREGEPALLSRILVGFGESQSALDHGAAADRAFQGALRIDRGRGRAGRADLARDLEAAAFNKFFAGETNAADTMMAEATQIRLSLGEGETSIRVKSNRGTLAALAYGQGDLARAEALFRSDLALDETTLGRDHPDLVTTLNSFARVLLDRRKIAEATPFLERALAITGRERGLGDPDMVIILANLATARRQSGRLAEAKDLLRQAIAVAEAQDHYALGPSLADLAEIECLEGDTRTAIDRLTRAKAITVRDYFDDWRLAWVDNIRGECLVRAGRGAEGRRLIASSSRLIWQRWPKDTLIGSGAERRSRL